MCHCVSMHMSVGVYVWLRGHVCASVCVCDYRGLSSDEKNHSVHNLELQPAGTF